MHLFEVLRKPLITEKGTVLQAQGKYVFVVDDDATKSQIKQSVEKAFKVTVSAVNVITIPGRQRVMGRRKFYTQPWKKAIVTLKPGDKIDIFQEA